jgi:HSP20 family protein
MAHIMANKFGPGDEIKTWTRRIQDIMDEMRNRSFCDYRASGTWLPSINIYACRRVYLVCVELAGLDRDSLRITCPDERHVLLAGERIRPSAPGLAEPFSVELMEIDEGRFERKVDFSEPVEVAGIELTYDEGFLWITLPKRDK